MTILIFVGNARDLLPDVEKEKKIGHLLLDGNPLKVEANPRNKSTTIVLM